MEFSIFDNNKGRKKEKSDLSFLGKEVAKKAQAFHSSFPVYKKTPLNQLSGLAKELGVKEIFVKDESYRFGLNAFKVLGGSFAIGTYIANQMNMDIADLPYKEMVSEKTKEQIGEITFISATDGNHGRGVAWTAKQLEQTCRIHMPKGSSSERLKNIQNEGAIADITDFNYDDAVRLSDKEAKENGWVLVQDTSWPGYEEIPTAIMQGYTTMGYEIYEQLKEVRPTHVFLQAGVGSYASAITGFFADIYKEDKPVITIVEPDEAACIYKTLKADDKEIHPVTGDMDTIMAGLACGEPVTVGIDILRNYADYAISCPDYTAAQGMRVLSSPILDDQRIISGESGAAGFGLFYEAMTNKELEEMKNIIGLDENSIVLCISTEGNTDQESYKNIVWNGAYPRPEKSEAR